LWAQADLGAEFRNAAKRYPWEGPTALRDLIADRQGRQAQIRGARLHKMRGRSLILPRACDYALYRERNLIERFFNKIKHFRAIATRYNKLDSNFLAAVQLVSAMLLLN
jgi:transposase